MALGDLPEPPPMATVGKTVSCCAAVIAILNVTMLLESVHIPLAGVAMTANLLVMPIIGESPVKACVSAITVMVVVTQSLGPVSAKLACVWETLRAEMSYGNLWPKL